MKQRTWMTMAAVALVGLLAAAAQAVTIDLVPVGNPGNGNDTRYETPGYGSVAKAYQIGKYEVTTLQYVEFLNGVAKTDTYGLYNANMWNDTYGCKIQRSGSSGTYNYGVDPDRANRPVNYVSFWDAARFTNWLQSGDTESGAYDNVGDQAFFGRNPGAKFFIPTENEWYKAAYYDPQKSGGAGYWDYPTRSDTAPINTPDPGNHANFYDYYGTGNGGYTIGSPYYTTLVGDFENSASAYGTFDQGGNLWEWNETAISSSRGLRGGYWLDYSDFLAASSRSYTYPANEGNAFGFRVASVPEPGSITLVVCGAIAGLIWWRRRK